MKAENLTQAAVSLVFGSVLHSRFAIVDRLGEVSVGSSFSRKELESKFRLTHLVKTPLNIRIDLYGKQLRNSHFKLNICLAEVRWCLKKKSCPPPVNTTKHRRRENSLQ